MDTGPRDIRDIDALLTDPMLDFKTAILLYESMAPKEAKISEEFLLQLTSETYREAQDEFTRRARRQDAASKLSSKITKVSAQRAFIISIRYNLPQYNFRRQGFSTGLQPTTFVPYPSKFSYKTAKHLDAHGVAVRFTNASAFAFAEMPVNAAERYSASFAKSRAASLLVAVEVEDTAPNIEQYGETYKVLSCKIKRLALLYTPKNVFGQTTDQVILSETVLEEAPKSTAL